MDSVHDAFISSDSEDDADYVPSENVLNYCDDSENINDKEHSKKYAQTVSESKRFPDLNENSKILYGIEEKKYAEEVWKNFLSDVSETENIKTLHNSGNENNPVSFSSSKASELSGKSIGDMGISGNSFGCTKNSKKTPPIRNPSKHLSSKRLNIDSILQVVQSRKQKASVLQKSLNDWNKFKRSEGIEEDVAKFNKGKQGFLERQRFLQRSELRCFQTEKMLKQSLKKA